MFQCRLRGDHSVLRSALVVCNREVCHPHCVIRLTRMERMYLSNTNLFVGRGM